MSRSRNQVIPALLIGGALLAGYVWWQHGIDAPGGSISVAPQLTVPATTTPGVPNARPIQYRLEPAPTAEALPTLDLSDDALTKALSSLIGDAPWQSLFVSERFVRRVVATVDNLPRREVSVKVWPVRPVGSWYETAAKGDQFVPGPANAKRYGRYLALMETVDLEKLAATYRIYYPLFQQAYVELGYPNGYFNDRLVVAIDDLLAAPDLDQPPLLTQKKVLYQFVDPQLENMSAGRKIMVRIGRGNADIVKARLRAFRRLIETPRPVPQ